MRDSTVGSGPAELAAFSICGFTRFVLLILTLATFALVIFAGAAFAGFFAMVFAAVFVACGFAAFGAVRFAGGAFFAGVVLRVRIWSSDGWHSQRCRGSLSRGQQVHKDFAFGALGADGGGTERVSRPIQHRHGGRAGTR